MNEYEKKNIAKLGEKNKNLAITLLQPLGALFDAADGDLHHAM